MRSNFMTDMPPTGNVTKWLCGLLVGVSIAAKLSERYAGVGGEWLYFQSERVIPGGEIWRLITHAFIKRDTFGLLLSTVVLWLFGRWYENSWGSRHYLRFFLAATVGGALISIPIRYVVNAVMPFHDFGMADGPDAAIDAMMMALALNAPDSKVMFGFVLPVSARSLIYILLGIDIISGIMSSTTNLSMTLGGILMGYLLVTGNWRPTQALHRFSQWRTGKKRRGSLYVVPPRDKHQMN